MRVLTIVALGGLLLLLPSTAGANPVDARASLERGEYADAAWLYEGLLKEQGPHPDLYYNLGLARTGLEDWPGAVLAFERSLALDPGHSDAETQLDAARDTLQRDMLASSTERKLTQGESQTFVWWRFFHWADPVWTSLLMLVGWCLVFVCIGARRMATHPAIRDSLIVLTVMGGFGATAAFGYAVGHYQTDSVRPAIITAENPQLRESPTPLAELSEPDDLYRGALVAVVDSQDGWLKIELPDGTTGWLAQEDLADIRVDRWPPSDAESASAAGMSRK